MNNEMIAKAWELAAEICSNFDCRLLNPPRSDEELDYLDLVTAEMKQQAGRIRAEEALIEGVHGNLISPNETENLTQPTPSFDHLKEVNKKAYAEAQAARIRLGYKG
jgi:hypothetical protein